MAVVAAWVCVAVGLTLKRRGQTESVTPLVRTDPRAVVIRARCTSAMPPEPNGRTTSKPTGVSLSLLVTWKNEAASGGSAGTGAPG